MRIGYYWVKHYNSNKLQIMYFNGFRFEGFKSDEFIHDEIESYIEVEAPETIERFKNVDKSNISDGYHTFNELYEHRHILFASLIKSKSLSAWKSKLHSDGTMFEGGWFIAGVETLNGMVTYHIPIEYWNLFSCIELDKAPEWDGHTPSDCITRLKNYCISNTTNTKKGNQK